MKRHVYPSYFTAFACRTSRLAQGNLLRAVVAGLLFVQAHSASAVLSFGRGAPTVVGCVRFANSPDSVTITGALTGPGVINTGLSIPANRIQYDLINCDQGNMSSWTLYYAPSVGPNIIGAFTPLGYETTAGVDVPQGGVAYTTLFNAGYGIYNYNVEPGSAAPWAIDYEVDHITFFAANSSPAVGLPANDGAGFVNPSPYLPSFAILYSPELGNGLVPASANIGAATLNGQVFGPVPGDACLSINSPNIVVETCNPCVPVIFSASAVDTCCSNVVLQYYPPSGTCFPVNTTTTVEVVGTDSCNNSATNFFTVTVSPGDCQTNPCISLYASNIVVSTCSNCTTVPFSAFAVDRCCTNVTLIYNPPETTCFPQNSTTPVQVTAFDSCGNVASNFFTVTVLAGDCPTNPCLSLYASNILVHTCSNCTTVSYEAFAVDRCCTNVTLFYNPPETTCFPQNSTTPVQVTGVDHCGNIATNFFTVTVLPGRNCASNPCISIYASNIVAYTCSSCTNVSYNTYAVDTCCPGTGATLVFNPPETTCFPQNSTTPVMVTAIDQCGNSNTATFTVTVLPAAGCAPTNCITIYPSNVVAYTCGSCTNVSYNTYAVDTCCPGTGAALVFNPPETTCFPQNSTTSVTVTATDQCGNSNTATFTVTVLPAAGCTPTNCVAIYASNIVVYTCSNCITVTYKVSKRDACCTNLTLSFNPPETFCFPLNSTTPVQVTGYDDCGNTATYWFTVTVLPGANCGGPTPLSITGFTNPDGSTTNGITVAWPAPNAQLQQSADLLHWSSIPGVMNSPYVLWNPPPQGLFFRLEYSSPAGGNSPR